MATAATSSTQSLSSSMATAAEIEAQIETARREVQESRAEKDVAFREQVDAIERQRLRRVLDELREDRRCAVLAAETFRQKTRRIDADEAGPHLGFEDDSHPALGRQPVDHASGREHVRCNTAVTTCEYIWRIEGLSWVVEALQQRFRSSVNGSDYFRVGKDRFDFHYRPSGGDNGTLAIQHCEEEGVTFRYKIYIKRRGGCFEQWGDTGNICAPRKRCRAFYGPDVPGDGGSNPQGVFGLSHMALLKSEWVEDDTMTVKFEFELRRNEALDTVIQVQVPPASISGDLSSLFGTGKGSDVTFQVQGELIKAHSQILCARSEVFDKLLHGGMQESLTKEIQVDDCDAGVFKELIRFFYTDEFSHIESLIDAGKESSGRRTVILQGLLAVSHKYALSRLRLWCEARLCDLIAVDDVCSMLCQAHLYDAKQLADACLSFIRIHYQALIVTEHFGKLAREWPEVIIRINLYMGRVQEDRAIPAIEAARRGLTSKRKREED